MPKLKLPRLPAAAPVGPLPPELQDLIAPPLRTATVLLGRREFLKAAAVVAAALAAPVTGGVGHALAAARGRFLSRTELRTLEALCDRILPPDRDPGAKALGAADYIDRMLAMFQDGVPALFAGGPFSNRNPFPDLRRGRPSHRRPRDSMKTFIPPTRLQELR